MIVGLGYKKRSGKDTAADYLVNVHGFKKMSWADPLKSACKAVFDWTDDHVYGDLKEVVDPRWGMTPRHVLQHVGTELFRAWIPDVWIRSTLLRITSEDKVVIPDVRFPNEAQAVKDAGGIVLLVDRPYLNIEDSHASEVAMDNYGQWDDILKNDGDFDNLYRQIDAVVDGI